MIAGLWDAGDLVTAELVGNFYKAMEQGKMAQRLPYDTHRSRCGSRADGAEHMTLLMIVSAHAIKSPALAYQLS